MNPPFDGPDGLDNSCEAVRLEFVSLLYGELESPERQVVERHLLACADCRARFEGLRSTRDELSLWEGPTLELLEGQAPDELAASVRGLARDSNVTVPTEQGTLRPSSSAVRHGTPARGRLVRFTARLAAVAAALLVTLSIFGTEVRLEDGAVRLTFQLPGSSPRGDAARPRTPTSETLAPEVRRIAAEELDGRTDLLRDEVAGLLEEFAAREETRRRELGSWLERIRGEDQQTLLELARLVDTSLRENQQSKEAIVELARVLLPNESETLENRR